MMLKPTFNPRKMMEQAVQVMLDSVSESRPDGKASPKVGAVLVKSDGSVDTACRGELRDGDHAEFTLLERKNRESSVSGCHLFATLEPCAPGARNAPKRSCAERIVDARIATVWIGIEDPDPTVDRKGIKYLQDHGVEVLMFDRDLQDKIIIANREFLSQAVDRAVEVSNRSQILLSPLESTSPLYDLKDLSEGALNSYRNSAGVVGDPEILHRRLAQQGLLEEQNGVFVPTGFGMLLFGKEPRVTMPQAGVLGTIQYDDGSEELEDFEGPLVEIPESVLKWLEDKLPNVIDRTTAVRTAANASLFELVREAIVNALVHRDYGLTGAKCHLIVHPRFIEIRSPGRPVEPVTVEQMHSFSAPLLSRNPALHYVFAKMKLAEERGLGLKSMRGIANMAGLPTPSFAWEDPYLSLTIYRNVDRFGRHPSSTMLARLSSEELAAWKFIVRANDVSRGELMAGLGITEEKAIQVLARLEQHGLLIHFGKATDLRYVASE